MDTDKTFVPMNYYMTLKLKTFIDCFQYNHNRCTDAEYEHHKKLYWMLSKFPSMTHPYKKQQNVTSVILLIDVL